MGKQFNLCIFLVCNLLLVRLYSFSSKLYRVILLYSFIRTQLTLLKQITAAFYDDVMPQAFFKINV